MARVRAARPQIPTGAITTYRRALFAALDIVQAQILRELEPRLRQDARVSKARLDVDPNAIDLIFDRVSKKTAAETKRIVGIPSSVPASTRDKFRKENVALIKSISEDQYDEISNLLDDAFKRGERVENIRKEIQERFDVSRSRADLIARDQVLKLNGDLTRHRQTKAGILSFEWSTSGDERVRESHAELDGQVFSWSDLPTVDDEDDVAPGTQFQCRCVAIAILPDDESVDEVA